MNDDELYREICRDPYDDTLRLAYADWLDENAGPPVRCGKCTGSGVTYSGCGYEELECPKCDGSGRVGATARAALAALIRLQCAPGADSPEAVHRAATLDAAVLAATAGGAYRMPCPDCGGVEGAAGSCLACGGWGDLRSAYGMTDRPRLTRARGLLDAIHCRPGEVFDWSAPTPSPTPWARAVVRSSPVTKFYMAGLEPAYQDLAGTVTFRGSPPGPLAWWYVVPGGELDVDWGTASGHWLPHWLRPSGGNATPIGLTGLDVEFYSTPKLAREDLAATAGRVVRAVVYGAADTRLSATG